MKLDVGKKVTAKAYVINNEAIAVNFDAVIEKVYERSVLLNVQESKVFPQERKAEFNNRLVVSFKAIKNGSGPKAKSVGNRSNKPDYRQKQHIKMLAKMEELKPVVQELLNKSITVDEIRSRIGYHSVNKMIEMGIVNRPETYHVKLTAPDGKVTYYKSIERMSFRHGWTSSTVTHYDEYRGYKIDRGLWNDASGEIKPVEVEDD